MNPLKKVEGVVAVLGGTRVYDYMLERGRIDEVRLSIEPIEFGEGLPMFTGVAWADFDSHLARHGVARFGKDEILNSAETTVRTYRRLVRGRPAVR